MRTWIGERVDGPRASGPAERAQAWPDAEAELAERRREVIASATRSALAPGTMVCCHARVHPKVAEPSELMGQDGMRMAPAPT